MAQFVIVIYPTDQRPLDGYRSDRAAFPNGDDAGLSGWLGGEIALLQQCGYRGVAAAKGVVELHRVAGVAGAVDGFETRGERGVEDIARLGESGKAVGLQHLGPEIGVISGGIAAAGEQVLEMRQAVAQADLLRDAHAP